MADAYVIRNQLGQYYTKKGEWVSGKEANLVFHQPHPDQALNQLIEINSKDIELRGSVVKLELDEKRYPVITEFGPDPIQPELMDESAETGLNTETEAQQPDKGEVAA